MPDKINMFKEKTSHSVCHATWLTGLSRCPRHPPPHRQDLGEEDQAKLNTRNVHILMKPSKYGRLKGITDAYRLNFNELLDIIFDEFLRRC